MSNTHNNNAGRFAIHLVIFLAGFSFLLYEVSWNRLLSLVLGATVTASTIVLATFMAGFGTGAWYWGRAAEKREKPGRQLATLFAGIGVSSALNYFLIKAVVPWLYASLFGNGMSTDLAEVLVFVITAGFLFIPAFMIGGIFPTASKIAVRSDDEIAHTLGHLYALDTLGSTIGGLTTGFLLLGTLGQMNTVMLAVAINLILGVWIYMARPFDKSAQPMEVDENAGTNRKGRKIPYSRREHLRQVALIGTFVCGFAILSLQVYWIRMFRIYLTNTSYTFALVASLVILGLFVGSTLFKRRQSETHYRRSMYRVLISMCVAATLGLVLLIFLPEVLLFPFLGTLSDPIVRVFVMPIVASVLIVFPPAVFSGFALPLACRMYTAGKESISGDVGFVLMINTIGSVVGPIVAAFVLLPLLGAAVAVLTAVLLLMVAAIFVLSRCPSAHSLRPVQLGLFVTALGLVVLIAAEPEIRILPPSFSRFDRDILFYRESVEGTLTVGQDRHTRTRSKSTFVNNASVIGSTYDAIKIVKMVGHFPFFFGAGCKDVLVIGFGIGVTTSAIAQHPEVQSIECVELVEGLKDAAVFYKDLNRNIVNDPRLNIIPGDGRHYLQLSSKKYDLISCDPTHPILGSGNLYTSDYFALCREHLNPGGMVSQFLPLHKLRTKELMGIVHTFHEAFPHSTVWLGHTYAMLLGSTEPLEVDFKDWEAEVATVGQDMYFYVDAYHLAATLALDGAAIERLTADSKSNTDDLSYTEFFAPSCLYVENTAKNLSYLMQNRTDVNDVFLNVPDTARMTRYVEGNRLLTEALYQRLEGNNQEGLKLLRMAGMANSEDQEIPFLVRLWY